MAVPGRPRCETRRIRTTPTPTPTPTTTTTSGDRKTGWRLALRLVASVGLVSLLVWQLPEVGWRDLAPDLDTRSIGWLAGAVIVTLAAYLFSTLRWRAVLTAFGQAPGLGRLFSHFLAGQFVSNVLPTAFGGDVVRIARLGADIADHPRSFASVAIERLTGWLVLPLITLTAVLVDPRVRSGGSATTLALATAAITLAALTTILLMAANRRWTELATGATGARRWLGAVHLGVDSLRSTPRAVVSLLGAGAVFQVLQCAAVWMLARGFQTDEVDLWAVFAFFPAAAILQNVPVSIGGLGVRESAFVVLFGALGTPEAEAISLGLGVYLLTVLTSALGAPAFAFGGRGRGPTPIASSPNPHLVELPLDGASS